MDMKTEIERRLEAAESEVARLTAELDQIDTLAEAKAMAYHDGQCSWKKQAETAEAKFQRCLESENRAQADLAAAEAAAARLRAALSGEEHAPGPSDNKHGHTGSCVKCLRIENARLSALVRAGLGLADDWDQIHLTGFCDSCAGVSLGNQRWIAKRIRVVLGGAK